MISTVTVLALALAARAMPAPANTVRDSTNSVSAVHQGNVRNGTAALLKAYKKWNLTPDTDASDSFRSALAQDKRKRQDSSAGATPDSSDSEYLVPVTIGGQNLNLDFDTGSADLWVFSSELASSSQTGHNIFDPSQSSTYQATSGCTWSIQYQDNSGASGDCGTDTVVVGGTTVTGQVVELAKTATSSFVSGAGDGLLGLAFSSINTVQPTQAQTFLDNAGSSLDSQLVAAYLPNKADGFYDFGATVSSRYSGDITYTDVDSSRGFWEFPSTKYKVGSTVLSQSGRTGIADTGTTLILTGPASVKAYYAKVSGSSNSATDGGYVFPCSASLPDFSFLIGTSSYATIPGSLMDFGPISDGSSTCYGSLQSVGSGTQNIYGDVFFNAYYGVFDASVPQFGFASLV